MVNEKKVNFNATNDRMFKLVFSYSDTLASLLSAILRRKIKAKDIVYEKTEEEDENTFDVVTPRYDIKIKLFSEVGLIMEMQKHKQEYDIMDRLLFYAARQYYMKVKKGSNYAKKKSIVICFTGFTVDSKDRCIDTFTVNNGYGYTVSGIKIITIAYKNIENCKNEEVKKWLKLITTNDFTTYEESGDILKKTAQRIQEFNNDEALYNKMLDDEAAYLDRMSQEIALKEKAKKAEAKIKKANAKAKEEEAKRKEEEVKRKEIEIKLKEEEKRRNNTILNLYNNGLSVELISNSFNLTIEEIQKIVKI